MASNSPIFAPDVQDINRRRQIAQALIAQGTSTPTGTEYAGGAAVKNSPILGIGNLLAAALGAYKKKSADADYNKALSNALSGIQSQTGPQPQPQAESPQISNVPQGTSAPNPPQNSDVGGMGTMPPQMAQQPAPQPQPAQPMSQTGALPQHPAQNQQLSMEQIMRMQQFPELKGYADMQLKQLQERQMADYKFQQEQQAAETAFKRAREGHQSDRTFDVAHPEDKTQRPYWLNQDGSIDPVKYNAAKTLATASTQLRIDNPASMQQKAPPGYRFLPDGSMEAIPGGPADAKKVAAFNQDTAALQGSQNSMDRLETAANELLNHPGLHGITGVMGVIPNVPGTAAADAQAKLNALKSQVAFGVLQDMRNNSKTGGALGAVSDKEGQLLQSNLASLEKAQSYEQMADSLRKIMKYSQDAKARLNNAFNIRHPDGEAQATSKNMTPASSGGWSITPVH